MKLNKIKNIFFTQINVSLIIIKVCWAFTETVKKLKIIKKWNVCPRKLNLISFETD